MYMCERMCMRMPVWCVCVWVHVWARVRVRVCGCVSTGACVGVGACVFVLPRVVCVGSCVSAFVGECMWVRG